MKNEVLIYLSRLLNKPIIDSTEITLTSAQRARFYAWLTDKRMFFNEDLISSRFTVSNLLEPSFGDLGFREKSKISVSVDVGVVQKDFIGIDIQSINELFPNGLPNDPKSDSSLTKIYTNNELSYAQSKDNSLETLTGIFCVKEAVKKCGGKSSDFLDVEVHHDSFGRPEVAGFLVSISHSDKYAVAIAMTKAACNLDQGQKLNSMDMQQHSFREVWDGKPCLSKFRLLDLCFLILLAIGFILQLT